VSEAMLYESPFVDVSPLGPDGLFETRDLDAIQGVLRELESRAAA
jgi:hypothetical protein